MILDLASTMHYTVDFVEKIRCYLHSINLYLTHIFISKNSIPFMCLFCFFTISAKHSIGYSSYIGFQLFYQIHSFYIPTICFTNFSSGTVSFLLFRQMNLSDYSI